MILVLFVLFSSFLCDDYDGLLFRIHNSAFMPMGICHNRNIHYDDPYPYQIVSNVGEKRIKVQYCSTPTCDVCNDAYLLTLDYKSFQPWSTIDGSIRFIKKGKAKEIKKTEFAVVSFADFLSCEILDYSKATLIEYSSAKPKLFDGCMNIGYEGSVSCSCVADTYSLSCMKYPTADCSGEGEVYQPSNCSMNSEFAFTRHVCNKDFGEVKEGIELDISKDFYYYSTKGTIEGDHCEVISIQEDELTGYQCNEDCQSNCRMFLRQQHFELNKNTEIDLDLSSSYLYGSSFFAYKHSLPTWLGLGKSDINGFSDIMETNNDRFRKELIEYEVYSLGEGICNLLEENGTSYTRLCASNGQVYREYYDGLLCEGNITRNGYEEGLQCGKLVHVVSDLDEFLPLGEEIMIIVATIIGGLALPFVLAFFLFCCMATLIGTICFVRFKIGGKKTYQRKFHHYTEIED